MTTIKTPLQMLEHWETTFPDQVYLRQSTGAEWIDYSWKTVSDKVRRLAAYIDQKAFPTGSRIAIWSANSVDWVVADLAIMMSGHISVPLYPAPMVLFMVMCGWMIYSSVTYAGWEALAGLLVLAVGLYVYLFLWWHDLVSGRPESEEG